MVHVRTSQDSLNFCMQYHLTLAGHSTLLRRKRSEWTVVPCCKIKEAVLTSCILHTTVLLVPRALEVSTSRPCNNPCR